MQQDFLYNSIPGRALMMQSLLTKCIHMNLYQYSLDTEKALRLGLAYMMQFRSKCTLQDDPSKITEFDYENYLSPALLEGVDTNSAEFKNFVRSLNLLTKTKYEAHQANKKAFSAMMGTLSGLNAADQRALIHLIKNKGAS